MLKNTIYCKNTCLCPESTDKTNTLGTNSHKVTTVCFAAHAHLGINIIMHIKVQLDHRRTCHRIHYKLGVVYYIVGVAKKVAH